MTRTKLGLLTCTAYLCQWSKGKKISLKFEIPMVGLWTKPRNHVSDCYFRAVDLTGVNSKNCNVLKQAYRSGIGTSSCCSLWWMPSTCQCNAFVRQWWRFYHCSRESRGWSNRFLVDTPHHLSQNELNDFVRDRTLLKSSAVFLAYRFKGNKTCCLIHGIRITFFITTGIKSTSILP